MEALTLLGTLVFVVLFFGLAGVFVAKNLIHICGPNEALVFSGGTHRIDGKKRGYRVVRGGRGILIPLFETVDRIDLTNMIIEVSVTNAYSKGGIPLTVQGVANLKVASHEPALGNAIERFLTMDRKLIVKIAKETLEGNLRGVLSQLTPEEVNEDKITFAEKLLEEAEQDLGKLGLVLDTLKIQNVSDDVSYLDSIGRRQSAEVIKRARVAEAQAKAISTTREAENNQLSRLAGIEAQKRVVTAETERRIKDAQTKREAMIAEEIGQVKALIARAKADLKVQHARVEQQRRRLQADVIAPAEADMRRMQAEAKGDSAKIIEDGKATVAVLEEMISTWQQGGENARDIFLMQKLQTLMGSLVGTIDKVRVDRVTVLPAGDGSGAANKAVRVVEELKGALGVDLPKLLETAAGARGASKA
jgi:flotillin